MLTSSKTITNLKKDQKPLTRYLTNSEDPDEVQHNAAFHQGLHCLLRQNRSSLKNSNILVKFLIFGPSIYTMGHFDFIVYSFMESLIDSKGLNLSGVCATK